jgi:hypothetical protein
VVHYDVKSVYENLGMAWRGPAQATVNLATERQRDYLTRSFGVENLDGVSKIRANTLLNVLTERRKSGKASHKQVGWLIAKGIEPSIARAMPIDEASQTLKTLFGR